MKDKISVLVSEEELVARIREMGEQISRDFAGEPVHLLCILKGSIFITCELAKHISVPVTMDFIRVSSYGNATKSSGVVKIVKDTDESIEGKNVIVIEDIIDSGNTLYHLLPMLKDRHPKSMKLVTLLNKSSRRERDVNADYVGFEVPDKFVVGFGLDYMQYYRNLPYIGAIEELGDERA